MSPRRGYKIGQEAAYKATYTSELVVRECNAVNPIFVVCFKVMKAKNNGKYFTLATKQMGFFVRHIYLQRTHLFESDFPAPTKCK
jgi:hypothetical protein